MKKKRIIIETTYFGSIKKCISLNKENNYTYINSEIESENRLLLKTNEGKFITGSDYINGKNRFLDTKPTREGELYIDESSLLIANECYEDKIKEKSLHL